MASDTDWRASLTSSDRYDNIQSIKKSLEQSDTSASSSQGSAFTIENEAYKTSLSRDQYNAACQNITIPNPSASASASASAKPSPASTSRDIPESLGITIGSYHSCHHVAGGVTAEVYRSKAVALKVIVETRDMEPHNPFREAKILRLASKSCIPLIETFRDQEQRFVLAFPFMPTSLEALIEQGPISMDRIRKHFTDLFNALEDIHQKGIIHRDIKPSAILLQSADGPAYLSDFGTAWHPEFSAVAEPANEKILDIGTGPYRAPEALFGDRSYGPAVDMWGAGAMLAECCRDSPQPLFESRPAHEDGSQLGLILSIFKTIGSPTPESWPEAVNFKTPPFEIYNVFEGQAWHELLPDVNSDFRELIAALVVYESRSRATASEVLQFKCMLDPSHNHNDQ